MKALRNTGGVGYFSDGMYYLAYDLQKNFKDHKIHFADWGYMMPIHFLTRGEVDYSFGGYSKIKKHLEESPNPLFCIFNGKIPKDKYKYLTNFLGREPSNVKTYYQRNGNPLCQALIF